MNKKENKIIKRSFEVMKLQKKLIDKLMKNSSKIVFMQLIWFVLGYLYGFNNGYIVAFVVWIIILLMHIFIELLRGKNEKLEMPAL